MKELTGKNQLRFQKKDKKKLTLFLGCGLFSVCLWLLFSLSKTYTYTTPAYIEFSNIPEKRSLSLPRRVQVSLKIEGSGWQLLTSRINLTNTDLFADLSGHKVGGLISLTDFIPDFNLQLPPGQRLLALQPDTIHLNYTGRSSRKIPLLVRYSINFQKQFYLLDPVSTGLDSVTISGPSSEIWKIRSWETKPFTLGRLNHSTDTLISLLNSKYPGLLVKPEHLKFSVKVDQFTEDVLIVPVHIINNPSVYGITLIPSRIKVYFQVPLTYFYNIRPELFEITADLNDWKFHRSSKLKLTVNRSAAFIRIEKLEPASVDFLIKK